ncbi:MAG: type VI secretion system membrane subunit TssM, partial [Candidatus Competibacterales bacterium]
MTVLIELAKKLNLLSLLGVVGPIAVGIWFLGPLLVFGDFAPLRPLTNRLMAIGLLLVGWGVYCLVAWLMSRRREGSFSKALAKEGDDGPRPDTAELRREFQRTLKALRRAKVRIYQLPWYAIIGTSGTGKTTALINSGLNFPLAKSHGKRAVRGVGSTKQCDWWFTDEAVLLDTAGRYATQEQARVDEGEWLALLDLLRRHRRRRPLNGVFVAISAADLIQMDEEGRAEWAGLLRRRLTEMNERLGVWLPIYLLVTKCDLLVGFVEFFADLDRAGREQIWGFTLPLAVSDDPGDGTTSPVAERVGSEFDLLEERLIQWQTQRLQDERDMRRRDLIHSFPQQFAALKGALEDFVEVVFTANRFEATARLRGVYFTSATQQGTPIDRLLGRLTSRLGLAAQALASAGGRGRSYFLTEALRLAIGESELVGQRSRGERRARWVTTAGLAALLTIGAGLGIWFYASYRANWLGVAEASTAIDTLEDRNRVLLPEDRAPVAALPILDGVRQLPWGAQEGSPPGTRGAGFDQGDKLAPVTAYHRLLGEALLPRLVVQLEEALHRSAGQDLYATLVAYLRLGTPERFEATGIRNWFADAWANDIRLDDGERRRLTEHLEVLLAHHQQMPVPTLSEPLVAEARARLSRVPTAQRLYARLQVTAQGLAPFRLGQAAGLDADRVLVRPSGRSLDTALSGLYTRVGYYRFLSRQLPQVLQDAAGDTWVLGTSYYDGQDSALQLQGEICQLYLSDYAQQWQDLLDDLALAPLIEPVQASIALERMAAPDSPMRLGLVAIARESLLSRPPPAPPVSEEAGEAAPPPLVPACPPTVGEQYVDHRFAALQ